MKDYKKKIITGLILSAYIVSTAGCGFVSKKEEAEEVNGFVSENIAETVETPSVSSEEPETSESSDIVSKTDTSSNESEKKKSESSETDSSKDSESSKKSEDENQVTEISLDVTKISLKVGETQMPRVTMKPSSATNKGEIWKSSDEKVAAVSENGTITGVGAGKCSVTVTSEDNPKVSATVSVTVKEEKKPKVSEISVSFTEATIAVGQTIMPTVTMSPWNADTLEEIWKSNNEKVATVDEKGNITAHSEGSCTVTVTSASNKSVSCDIKILVEEEQENDDDPRIERDSSGAAYIDGILIVNKQYGLPSDYNPGGLTSECAQAFEELRKGAKEDDIDIYLSSGFRSYQTQSDLYNSYVSLYGKELADTFSARPGHSEHQAGLAIDCNDVSDNFIGTPEADWLAEHSWEYGFIIRYPQGKESITGYKYEPWHIRYVGREFAEELYLSGLTLEEYFF